MFIDKDIHPRIREWFYTQMLYWLRYVLNTTDCDGAVDKSFDEMLEEMYRKHVYQSTHSSPQQFITPVCKCLWDVLFHHLGEILYNYKRILRAYKAKYEFTTKEQIYHRMITELDSWIDTIDDRNTIITIALGMTLNINIFDMFYRYHRLRPENRFFDYLNGYNNILNALEKINFDATNISIDYWYYIDSMRCIRNVKPYTPHVQQVDDLQSVYSSHITAMCRYSIHNMEYYPNTDSDNVTPITIQYCIQLFTDYVFGFPNTYSFTYYLQQYGWRNNITDKWQILDHIKTAIGPYPKTLEPVLELCRTHRFKFYHMERNYFKNYSSMTELIDFDTVPMDFILHTIIFRPIEQIKEECTQLAKTYTGRRIKAAKHEENY